MTLDEQRLEVERLVTTARDNIKAVLDAFNIPTAFVAVVIRDSSGLSIATSTLSKLEGGEEHSPLKRLEEVVEEYVLSLPGVVVPSRSVPS